MTSKAEDKVEIVVQVESKDTSSKVILIMLIIVLFIFSTFFIVTFLH